MDGTQITTDDIGKPELMAWAEANGLNPRSITMQSGCLPEVWGDCIFYGYVPQDEDGKDLYDQFHSRLFVVPRTKKVAPLPDGVGRAIEKCEQIPPHECPTCEAAETSEKVVV
jgi:hypothetical protein